VPDSVKVGAFVVLVGFLAISFMTLFAVTATVNTLEDAVRIARSVQVVQGIGWMVVGIGFFTAFLGVVKSD
jgi:ABC-type transport system involved in cytochrome c biogenesis permease subunit